MDRKGSDPNSRSALLEYNGSEIGILSDRYTGNGFHCHYYTNPESQVEQSRSNILLIRTME